MKYIIIAISVIAIIQLVSCCGNKYGGKSEYPKRLYWDNGSFATQINDSIVIVIDRKELNKTESKVINLKHGRI